MRLVARERHWYRVFAVALALTVLVLEPIPGTRRPTAALAAEDAAAPQTCSTGEVVAGRTRDMKVFRNENCSFTAMFGHYLHYQDAPGRWEDVDLKFRQDGHDYVMDRHDLVVRVPGAQVEITERGTGKGIRWLTPIRPSVAGRSASFQNRGLDWTYATTKSGLKLEAVVGAPLGPQTYDFTYQLLGGAANLAQDQAGNLVSDAFAVPKAVVYGADGSTYPAGAWQLLPGRRAAFDFDDSTLPQEAFPYVLDPTTTFGIASGTDDGYVGKAGPTYPPLGIASVDTTATTISAMRSMQDICQATPGLPGCPEHEIRNALIRWDTSSLPDNAAVTGATARLRVTTKSNSDSRSLTGDWYTAWPIDSADYSETAWTAAISGVALSSIPTNAQTDFTLSSAGANVSKTGYSGLRLHISGSQASGTNYLNVVANEHPSLPEPALFVTFNTPPATSAVSDSPDPVTAGDALTFDVSWSDPDPGDQVRGVICKTNQISSTGTCPGGAWTTGTSSATSPSSATYVPTAANHGTKTYFAFACDQGNLCSSSASGTFTVTNRTPSISSASDAPDPVLVGNAVTFSVGWVDPGDSVRAVICKTNQVTAGVCPGGAWALGTSSASSPSSAPFVPTVADYGEHTYFAFACDAAGACSSAVSSTFTVYQPIPAGGVEFLVPETLHSNGAELRWTRYAEPVVPFDKYSVHRSSVASFTPSDSTLLTEIRDPAVAGFTDTTAAPGQVFTYKLVVNGDALAQTVTLPAAGKGTKLLQPDPAGGTTTRITSAGTVGCENHGGEIGAPVGTSGGATNRALLSFDLHDIPAGADVDSATLQVRHGTVTSAMIVDLHAVKASWREGTGAGACTGDGATWAETEGGVAWANAGGDFDPTRSASVNEAAGEAAGWDSFDITELAQAWANGDIPNLGMILKARDEAATASLTYATDDEVASPAFRPKLSVTYDDSSASTGPTVEISSPRGSDLLRGSVQLAATATDDRRVDNVEFLVDGNVVGQDATRPFDLTWSSAAVANGSRSFTARATDDVGNVSTSAPVSGTVDNSTLTVSITSALSGAVPSQVDVTANAADADGVSRVEFLFDGLRFAEDTAAPYTAVWDTLDPELPAYDGEHMLTAVAYDTYGRSVESDEVLFTVANRTGKYKAGFTTSGGVPQAMTYDPLAQVQQLHAIDVTVTNLSDVVWDPATIVLRYSWFKPEATSMFVTSLEDSNVTTSEPILLGGTLVAPGNSAQVRVLVKTPDLAAGTARGTYRLQFDLYDQVAQAFFAAKGNQPSENAVVVNNKLMASAIGVERYYHYRTQEVGAGMTHMLNVANGNSLLQWTPWVSRGRGLSTALNLSYNSLEGGGGSLIGNNWSLSLSSLIRLGVPLDVHPNSADVNMGRSNRWIEFTDADGTTHRFEGKQHSDGTVYWEEPAGVHLYLRQLPASDTRGKWALTRPDRVTFIFDAEGFPTMVEDHNKNRLTFTSEAVPAEENPGGVSRRITKVTDAGAGPNNFFTISYYSKDEEMDPQIRGKVKAITDQSGSKMNFEYYGDGNLLRITQKGGTTEDITVPDRSFVFTYTNSSGTNPAISNPAARVNPDPGTAPQSTKLYSVRDPMGTETTFSYVAAGQDKWKLLTSTDRIGAITTYVYDIENRRTTVTNPTNEPTIARTYKYDYDTDGKVTGITNPRNEVTSVVWTADRHVEKVVEPSLAQTTFKYNPNGYLTERVDQNGNRTTLDYQNIQVDSNDVEGKMKAGRGAPAVPHISLLTKRTDPSGNATGTAGDFEWKFQYTDVNKNLTDIIDPTGATTHYTWDQATGTLTSARDAKGKTTSFLNYDKNGCPTRIVDAENGITTLSCDDDGLVRWIRDPVHNLNSLGDVRNNRTSFEYDVFHRLSRQSMPKSSQLDSTSLIWTGTEYDRNDNVVATVSPHYAGLYTPSKGFRTETTYDAMDRPTRVKGPDTSVDPAGERTDLEYDKLGRLKKMTSPRGVATPAISNDFQTQFTYDSLDRVVTETVSDIGAATTRNTHYCYDDPKGDLKWVVSPRAALPTVNCGLANPPAFTTKYTYDAAHRLKSEKDGLNHEDFYVYDANGNVTTYRNASGNEETREYDQRNALVKVTEPFEGTRTNKTKYVYDPNGNLMELISPRAWDASGGQAPFSQFVTKYEYDGLNRLVKVLLPKTTAEPQQYVHHEYDKNGNLLKTSLPTTTATPNGTPMPPKTVMTYFDPGWIRSSDDAGQAPPVDFDYFAEGWQKSRTPQPSSGAEVRPVSTTYFPDGMVKSISDRAKQSSTFAYDANNNLTSAKRVATSETNTSEIVAAYDGFDQLARLYQRRGQQGNWTASTYEYDANGNVSLREDDQTASSSTATPSSGRRHIFVYDDADWLRFQTDNHATSGDSTDDQQIETEFFPTGWEKKRIVRRASGGTWAPKQTTEWSYFANGKLKTLNTSKPSGTIESHTIDYLDGGIYVNGNRTKDTFTLDGQNTECLPGSACAATYTYDARDRLTNYTDGQTPSTTTVYDLDTVGNIKTESVGTTVRKFEYSGDRLLRELNADNIVQKRYWYDPYGNLDCVTNASGTEANCSPSDQTTTSSANLVVDYAHDSLNRLTSYRAYTAGSRTDKATYEYDALDRVTTETEIHPGTANNRTTNFTYLGLSSLVTGEDRTGTSFLDKSYGYDAYGNRITMTNTTGSGPEEFTYAYDTHGSVSALVPQGGGPVRTYGYTPYGGADADLTKGDDQDPKAPLNPHRYSAKRLDPGSDSYDMGARRYGADPGRFLEQDLFMGALSDLGLSLDPITQNRYGLAGGNPISFAEWDGHMVAPDGGGGGVGSPRGHKETRTVGLVPGMGSRGRSDATIDRLAETYREEGYKVRIYPWCYSQALLCGSGLGNYSPQDQARPLRNWAAKHDVDILVGHSKGGVLVAAALGQVGLGAQKPLPDLDRAVLINAPLTQNLSWWAGQDKLDRVITEIGLNSLQGQQDVDLISLWNTDDIIGGPAPSGVRDLRYSWHPVSLRTGVVTAGPEGNEHRQPAEAPCVLESLVLLTGSGVWRPPSCPTGITGI